MNTDQPQNSDSKPNSVAKTFVASARQHIEKHRASYIWLPISIVLLLIAVWGVGALTGRSQYQPQDPSTSADVLIGIAFNVIQIAIAIAAVALVKSHEALNRSIDGASGPIVYAASRLQTVLLLALFLWAIKH